MVEYTIKELPVDDRPREKLKRLGPKVLTDSELLALIIRSGTKGNNALDLSRQILSDFDLKHLSNFTVQKLCEYQGIGEVKAGQIIAALELAQRFSKERVEIGQVIDSFQDVVDHFGSELHNLGREELRILHLSNSNQLISEETVFHGSLDELPVKPREIVKSCMNKNSKGIILIHNHPGGKAAATREDLEVTRNIEKALSLVSVKLLDHIIYGKEDTLSMKREGYL